MVRWVGVFLCLAVLLIAAPVITGAPPQLSIRTADTKQGLKVTSVALDGLGHQMKLKQNDMILKMNGRNTNTSKDLREALAKVDEKVEIVVLRNGQRKTITGTLRPAKLSPRKLIFMPDR